MEPIAFRKARQHFETATNPPHVTFDDGKSLRRNLPWSHFVEARWSYMSPDIIEIEIGIWIVMISGYNLQPLFEAIEDQTLVRLQAKPELEQGRERDTDTFVTTIRFVRPSAIDMSGGKKKPSQLGLGIS